MLRVVTSIFALIYLLGSAIPRAEGQSTLEGHWEGTMVREGASLPVSFDLKRQSTGLSVFFNSPLQRATGIPTRNVSFAAPKLHFDLVGDTTTIVFDGVVKGENITGEFRENDARGTFALRRVVPVRAAFSERDISFSNGTVTLAGTLLLPTGAGPHPAVVFLHGSGAEARYASRFLAEHLANHGIAALIYDKRGAGKSTGDWRRSDFNDLASDAIAAIGSLRNRPEINARKIGIYGHSQGGMIAPLIASRSRDAAFVISAAGSAVPLYVAEVNSLVNQLRAKGMSDAEMKEAVPFINRMVQVLRTGKERDEFDAESKKVESTRWYPLLHVPARDDWFWAFYARIANYDASEYWSKVTVPSLVIYGERDELVPVSKSISNINRALNSSGNTNYTIVMLPRASHTLNIGAENGAPFEWTRLSPGYPDLLLAWIDLQTSR